MDYSRIQKHLDRVSRSFAFCIQQLQAPFQEEVGLSYLLFRVIDTIEDYQWSTDEAQNLAYDQFLDLLKSNSNSLSEWIQKFPKEIKPDEKALIEDSTFLINSYQSLSADKKEIIYRNLKNMSEGMKYFKPDFQNGTNKKIKTLAEFNTYCFFVAGIVGELLSELYKLDNPSFDYEKNKLKSIHFGLFLQKINILKDQLEDQKFSRSWIHERQEVLYSLKANAQNAFEYILDLPKIQDGYRLFCAWSFFLGLASLPYIEKSWEEQKFSKISKLETLKLIHQIQSKINDDEYLLKIYANKSKFFSNLEPLKTENQDFGSSLKIHYSGNILPEEFKVLQIAL